VIPKELEYAALALLNLTFSLVTIGACICRLAIGSPATVRRTVRVQYVALLVGAFCSGFSPLLFPYMSGHGWPGPGQVILSLTVMVMTAIEWDRWRYAPPEDVRPDAEFWRPDSGIDRRFYPDRRRYH
jgi:hypothetical protein